MSRRPRAASVPAALVAAVLSSLAVTALLLTPAGAARGAAVWYPHAGASWYTPLDAEVRDLYGSAPGVAGGLGCQLAPAWSAEVSLGWFRAEGVPEVSLVPSARGRLTCLPFFAEARWRPLRLGSARGSFSPCVSLGPAIVFSREVLSYRAFGDETRLRGKRSDAGGTAALALEWSTPRWRAALGGRVLLTGGHREVVRADGESEERSARATPSCLGLGLELRVPLP